MTFSPQPPLSQPSLGDQIAAALDWWRDAGVDLDFEDTARDWLAGKAPAVTAAPEPQARSYTPPPPPPAPPAERIGGDSTGWPATFAAFAPWWLSEPSLDGGQVFGRIAPRGPQDAELMVLVEQPESVDADSLLSGEQGKLLARILAAIEIDPAQVYFASVLPRAMPLPDWPALANAGLGELTRHHAALARPNRILSFGSHASSLLGHSPAKTNDPATQFYHVGGDIPALAARSLDQLLARPKGKASLWRDLLDWQA